MSLGILRPFFVANGWPVKCELFPGKRSHFTFCERSQVASRKALFTKGPTNVTMVSGSQFEKVQWRFSATNPKSSLLSEWQMYQHHNASVLQGVFFFNWDPPKGSLPEKNVCFFISLINGRWPPPPRFYKVMLRFFLKKCQKVRKRPARQKNA